MLKIARRAQRAEIPSGFDAVAFNEPASGRFRAIIVARIKMDADFIQAATGGTIREVRPDHVEVIVDGKTADDLQNVLTLANGFDLVVG